VTHRVVTPEVAPRQLRLVDLNVLHGYDDFPRQEERAERTVAALAALEPDILVLQEAWRTRRHGDLTGRLAEALQMDAAYARANGKLERIGFEEGEAILSRFPILQALRLPLEPRKPFFERRIALVCVLDLGGGEVLTLVGTHLDHRRPAVAAAQARHLAATIAGLRSPIVAGDLNAESGSPALRAFVERGYRDLLGGGIDHVLVPADLGWRVADAQWTLRPAAHGPYDVSDHPGLVVDLVRHPAALTGAAVTPKDGRPAPDSATLDAR
jgi:endonuclease/exonuclease/phosphatase family metal-dependent hydrolase